MSLSNEYYFNKEIFFYIAILFTSLMYIFLKKFKSLFITNIIIVFIFLISGLLLLVHEAFLFFGGFIFSLIILKLYSPYSPYIGRIIAIIFIKFCLVIFGILVYYKGDLTTSEAIWLSLSDSAKEITGNSGPAGGISAISWSLLTGLSLSVRAVLSGLASYYIFSFILIYLFLGFILFERGVMNLRKIYLSKNLLLPLSIVVLTFVPLFMLGWDWGRWVMGIYYISLIIFLLELDKIILQFFLKKNFALTKKFSFIYFLILLFLALITRVPGCCFNASGNSALNNPALFTIKNYFRIIGEYFNIYIMPFNL
jgi:hypothetical protein